MKSSSILSSRLSGAVLFLIAFIGVTATVLGGTELVLRQCLIESDTNDGIYARRYLSVLNAREPDVLLGDSQFLYAFGDGFGFTNLAYQGESPELLLLLAKRYFCHIDPGRVILLAGHQLFAANRAQNGPEGYENYFMQANMVQHWLGFHALVFEPGLIGLVEKWIDVPSRFPSCNITGPVTRENAGQLATASGWDRQSAAKRQTLMQNRLERQRPVKCFKTSSQFKAYEQLVEFLLSRGARICMVRPPLTSSYEEMVMTDTLSMEAIYMLRQLANSEGVRFVDYTDLTEIFHDDMFVNQDHLNTAGAELFAPAAISKCFKE